MSEEEGRQNIYTCIGCSGAFGTIMGYQMCGVTGAGIGLASGVCAPIVSGATVLGILKGYQMYVNRIERAATPIERQLEINHLVVEMRLRGETSDVINMVIPTLQESNISLGVSEVQDAPPVVIMNPIADPPSLKKGGLIKRTGMALVHKGEYVVPRHRVKKCKVCV